jgi:hypothetical protein
VRASAAHAGNAVAALAATIGTPRAVQRAVAPEARPEIS